jgi:hypothetical protein
MEYGLVFSSSGLTVASASTNGSLACARRSVKAWDRTAPPVTPRSFSLRATAVWRIASLTLAAVLEPPDTGASGNSVSPSSKVSGGLGLSLVRWVAERHRGTARLIETGGRGAGFEVVLARTSLSRVPGERDWSG